MEGTALLPSTRGEQGVTHSPCDLTAATGVSGSHTASYMASSRSTPSEVCSTPTSPRFPQGSFYTCAPSSLPVVSALALLHPCFHTCNTCSSCSMMPLRLQEAPPPMSPEPSSLLPRLARKPGAPTCLLGLINRNALHPGWDLSWPRALPLPPAQIQIQRAQRPGVLLCFILGPGEPLAACKSLSSPVLFA